MVSCDKIRLKGMVMEDFVNYKVPSMFLITSICDWKCCKEANIDISICQNQSLTKQPTKTYSYESIYQAYVNNPITKAIVIGGLEPFDQFEEIFQLILYFRAQGCDDMFVVYTGYDKHELSELYMLKMLKNITVKFGRFKPNNKPHFDSVLGVNLISDNQYAEVIS